MSNDLDTNCNLCHIRRGVIARGPLWTMVLNENQTLLGRCYFALNRHETDVTCLDISEQLELFDWLARAKSALDRLFSPEHYNYVLFMNLEPHIHAHIIPRYHNDRDFGGQTFHDGHFGGHYDPSSEKILSAELFDELVGSIGAEMQESNRV